MDRKDEPAELILGVSDFVALLNQTLDYAYPSVTITGELANLRVSKNRWLYFDLKDELASVKFFGTVRQLPGPLEDGMLAIGLIILILLIVENRKGNSQSAFLLFGVLFMMLGYGFAVWFLGSGKPCGSF